jgi:glycosyltransferase involved in cell wall biosynthesis
VRIGIDATTVSRHRTGVGNYIVELVRGLADLRSEHDFTVFASPEGEAEFEGLPGVRTLPIALASRGARLMWEQALLPGLVRRERLDLLHSPHYTMPLVRAGRSVVTFHDLTFVTHPEWHVPSKRLLFPRMMRWSAGRASHLIADSESTRADMIRVLDVPPARVTAVPLGAGTEYTPAAPAEVRAVCDRHGLEPGRYILYIGVLEPRKNIPRLVGAFARIADRVPGVALVIGGKKGWMYDQIFEQVQRSGLGQRVRFLGYVAHTDLPALYTGALVFAYPSWHEGFGLPVLEAMRCGAAVVTSNVSSLPEVAGDGALQVAPDDEDALAAALLRLAGDEALRTDLGHRARARAAAFSWHRCARETLRVYEATR